MATACGAGLLFVAAQPIQAAFTWDGGGANANWSTANNWNPNGAPTAGTITDYIFDGTVRTTNSANGATLWEVNSITFNSTAGAFVISGTGLKLQSTGIINNDVQLQTINNTIALQGTATINAASGAITLGGVISGAGFGITKTGANTLTLKAANTYTGLTTVSAGTLAFGVANALASGNVTVSGGTLAMSTFSDTVGAVSLTSGSITGSSGVLTGTSYDMQSGTVSAILGGSGAMTKSTTGTVTLSGANTYTGTTTINAGTLVAAANNALGTTGGATTVNSGGTLGFQGGITYSTAEAVTINGTGAAGSSGAIDNISGTNSFAGPITVSADSQIGATAGALTLSGTVNLAAAATADRTLTFNTAASTSITVSGQISDALNSSYALGVTQVGNGTLILSNGTNNYYGDTSVGIAGGTSTGTLRLGANNALPTVNNTSALNIYSGTLDLNNFNATAYGTLALGGGGTGSTAAITTGTGTLTLGGDVTYNATNNPNGATIAGKLALGATRTFTVNDSSAAAADLTVSAVVSGTNFGITKAGAGTMVLSGTNTYTGVTTINAGTLSVGTIGNGGVAGNLGQATNAAANLVLGGGTLQYTGATASTDRNLTLTTGTTSTIDVSGAANLTMSGASTATTGGLTKAGTGTLTLTGTNLYTGATTINAGTLSVGTIGNGGVAGNLGQATNAAANLVLGGGTLQYTGATASTDRAFTLTNATTSTINVSSAATNLTMSGSSATTSGGLTKAGAGTLTLSGTNTYTGATTVSAGTLMASGANSLGDTSGNITVSAGATLALAGGTNVVRSGLLTLNGSGVSSSFGALAAEGATGTTSQWTGSTTVNTASTISAADNLLIIGNGATGQFNSTTLTLNANVTFNTTAAATVVPTYLPAPAYVLDASNIVVNSQITGTGGIIKTGTGTLSLIRGTSVDNTFTGDTSVLGGKLIVDGPSNHTPLSSTNIYVGNLGSASNDTVTLQMGELATASGNNIIGTYNAATDASNANLTIYEDGVFKMNQGNNGFINLTMSGGHVDSGGNNALLTLSGSLTTLASAQTSLIENGNLGIGSNKLALNIAGGTTASGIDLEIDSKIQQGALFAAVASGTALEKNGAGKVVLTGANTYGGVTDVLAGVLNIQNNTALGQDNTGYAFNSTNNGTTVSSGAQLQVQGGITVARETLTLAGTGISSTGALRNVSGNNNLNSYVYLAADARINSDSGTLTIANPSGVNSGVLDGTSAGKNLTVGGAGNTTINGAIGSSITNITKDGTGTLTLAGNDAYTGATAVTAGALKVTHSNGLAGTGVTVSNNAALQFAQDAANANIAEVGVAANITGTGISNGGAIENLNGNNSYAGNVTLAGNSRITSDSGSSLTMSGSVTGAGFALSAGGVGDTTYNGVVSGTGTTLTKTDSGTVTLGGTSANTYTGATSINDGTLTLNKTAGVNAIASTTVTIGDGSGAAGSATLLLAQSNQIVDTAALTLATDGRLNLNSKNETVGSIAGSGQILFGTGQLTEGGTNASTSFSGTLAGSAGSSLTKVGSGTLTISSNVNAVAGDFAGDLNLNAGGLTISASNAFTGTLNVAAGTTLTLSNANLSVGNLNFTGTGTVTLDFGGASTLNVLNNLTLSAGVTINIINWTNAVDYWYAANWSGAVLDLRGVTPMNQIIFDSPTWVGNNTIWQSYDHQITPVPEPSTYGALLLGATAALLGYRRHRRSKAAQK